MVLTQTLGIILPFCFQGNYDSPTFDYDRRTLGCDEHMHGGLAQAEGQASSPPSSHLKVQKILNIVPGVQKIFLQGSVMKALGRRQSLLSKS